MNRPVRCAWVGVVLLLAGCATPGTGSRVPLTGDILTDGPRMVQEGPAKDRVLWQYRTAAAAMRHGQFDAAKAVLDDALLTIGGIDPGDRSARRARSYFRAEEVKTFWGEPYERVMGYYYRGILYWMDGEPDNARACFRSAQLQDADTGDRSYASDYVLLDYLDGLATTKLSGDGSDAHARARETSRLGVPPAYEPRDNVLFFVEFGPGPVKYAGGEFGEQLRIRTHASRVRSARIQVGGRALDAPPYDDLNFQATTRGGRVMDHILANKAVFKAATDTIGDAALISGVVVGQDRRHQEVALGLVAAGLVSKLVAASTIPTADTRSWNNLPQFLSFATASLPAGSHEAVVEFLDEQGRPLSGLTKQITFTVGPGPGDTVVFVSDQSKSPLNL